LKREYWQVSQSSIKSAVKTILPQPISSIDDVKRIFRPFSKAMVTSKVFPALLKSYDVTSISRPFAFEATVTSLVFPAVFLQ